MIRNHDDAIKYVRASVFCYVADDSRANEIAARLVEYADRVAAWSKGVDYDVLVSDIARAFECGAELK